MDLAFLVFLGLNFLAASSGAIFRAGPWYESLLKPRWRPPGFLFGPVWMILFLMIATSGWLAWRAAGPGEAVLPMAIYGVHLVLNALWSAVFFGLRRPGLALVEMAALWLSIVATMVVFAPLTATAAWLLVPYLGWVSFAFVLNASIWRLNKDTPIGGVTL